MSSTGQEATPARSVWRRQVGLGLGVAAVTVLVWAILVVAGLDPWSCMLCGASMGGVTAALAARPVTPHPVATVVLPAGADQTIGEETLRRLRHDLRGILSPALMTADRLLMSTEDPVAKRAAETMVETIERAEKRLAG